MNLTTNPIAAAIYGGADNKYLLNGSILALRNQVEASPDGLGGLQVDKWIDESGYGQHAVPITTVGTPRPIWDANGSVAGVGNRPSVVFTGTQGLWIPNFQIPAGTKDMTFFWVTRAAAAGAAGRNYAELTPRYDLSTTGFQLYRTAAFAARIRGDVGTNIHTFGFGADKLFQAVRAEAFKSNSGVEGEVRIYRDGTLSTNALTTVDNTNDFQSADLYIGCRAGVSDFLDDPMAALVIFPYKVTGALANAIDKYLLYGK